MPETTRNIVMRPANGSATVFQMNAEAGPAVGRLHRDVLAARRVLRPASAARPATARTRRRASSSGCMPMFAAADADSTGKMRAGGDAALEPGEQLLLRQRAGVEELLHQRVVRFRDHLDQRFARRLRRSLELGRNRAVRSACRCRRSRTSTPSSTPDPRRRGTPSLRRSAAASGPPRARTRSAATRATARGWRARDRGG